MDPMFIFLCIIVIVMILGLFLILSNPSKESSDPTEKIEGTDFIPSQMFMGDDGLGGLAINERTKQLCLFSSPKTAPRILPIEDFIGSDLVKNGEKLGEGMRSFPEQVVTYGQGLRHQKESLIKNLHMEAANSENQRIDLIVTVHDEEDPLLVVNFLNMETAEGGMIFEKSLSTAIHWHNVLDGLILEADQRARIKSEAPQEQTLASSAT